MVDLSQELFGATFQNPVLLASGTCGYGEEYADIIAVDELGGIVTKAVTLEPRAGNPPCRVSETPAGMINSIGLANVGLERFKAEKLPWIRDNLRSAKTLVNVAGWSIDDFVAVVRGLDDQDGFLGYEINVSCPNVEGGTVFGTDEISLAQLVRSLRQTTERPLVVKLSPNVPDIGVFAEICEENGADGLSAINTFPGMLIDVEARRPVIGNVTGGISGPAIRPMGVYATWVAASRVSVPVIGIGGICNARDTLEYLLAGASLVQIGTAMFVDPCTAPETVMGLSEICERQGVERLSELVGSLEV
jgi:dihydroorotate dehydrogenase (NAD+) catalytic subunit